MLVEKGDENVILNLLRNSGARISSSTMEYLVDESQRVNAFQEPILRRDDLDPRTAKRMYMWVSAALRRHIVENFEIDQNELDGILETAALEASGAAPTPAPRSKSDQLADDLTNEGIVTPELLIQALQDGQVHLFVSLFRRLTGLRQTLITRFILEATGEGLAIACKALGFEKKEFAEIYQLCGTVQLKSGRVKKVDRNEVLELYDQTEAEAANRVVEHWRRDVDYLSAIRELGRSRETDAGLDRR